MKELYVNKNKYIRLRITKVGCTYRADISINKYAYDKNEERYYEINFDVFSPYDYSIPTIHGRGYQYYSEYYQDYRTLQNQVYLEECLNDEIEIIEEPKNIEKLELESGKIDDKEFLAKYITHNRYKINELIDEINNLKEK